MKKKICAVLLGVLTVGLVISTDAFAASQGDVTVSYVTPENTVIDKGCKTVQTGDDTSSAWIYTLIASASGLTVLAVLMGKRRKEGEEVIGN